MIRKILYLVGVGLMLSSILPAGPAEADEDDHAVATITGTVTFTDETCDVIERKEDGLNDDGHKVIFGGVAMAGEFTEDGNTYVGTVTVPATNPIEACSAWRTPEGDDKPSEDIPPLIGHGHIWGGYTFSGSETETGKCLNGDFLGGDFRNNGAVADVKFAISYENGTIKNGACEAKTPEDDKQMNCLGQITVVPGGGVVPDRVTGSVECHQSFDNNGTYPDKDNP